MAFEALYLPIGVSSFDVETAGDKLLDSKQVINQVDKNIVMPEGLLLSIDAVAEFLRDKNPDLVIVQSVTFADASYIAEIMHRVDCQIILWTIPEPVVDGTRLRLNSLTGAFAAGNTMANFGKKFIYIHGSTFDDNTVDKLKAVYKAAKLKKNMSNLNLLQVGHTQDGFGFGTGIENELMKTFGVRLMSVETRQLMSKALTYDDEAIRDFIFDAQQMIPNIFNIDRQNVFDAGRLFKAYFDYCNENQIGALASRCMPDFITEYGTPLCAVLSILNDLGIPSACEADTYGALSIYIAQYFSKMPAFFGSPVSMDEEYNSLTFWHCGMAPTTLAREDSRAQAGVHCNCGIGPTLEFGCRSSDHATVFRVGKKPDGSFRFFIAQGRSMDRFKQFNGTTVVIEPQIPVRQLVESAVTSGWEPHFAVALADISAELEALADMLGIEVVKY